ncbi:uncharacterized tRNA/rRNA methyltransferase YfiF-like [Nilaparvata lugens]|uniref:uncharacterized tRNA/rRNA methyltransferase YfiF-like n=1 Tax=Nilaparvata lugens TaxID=108931 RepID=UPI00193C9576|nr:uncharacterized tRNA/rRNA methyltransferase YfiF-like [Nilaparvata lugens]
MTTTTATTATRINVRPAKARPADGARSGRTGQDKARGGNDRRGADPAAVKAIVSPSAAPSACGRNPRLLENACQALFASRPEAIVRAWFVQSVTPRFREALRWMAANRKAYHVVDEEELAKASGTEHHGGVCFLIKKRQGLDAQTYLKSAPATDCVLALEEVGNPTALLESGAAVRTAEGGAEHIKAINADDFLSVLDTFRKAGYTIVTTSSHKGTALAQAKLPAKMVLVLGQERDGLSDSAWQQGDMNVSIGGTGKVESLNVSVATGILLADGGVRIRRNLFYADKKTGARAPVSFIEA